MHTLNKKKDLSNLPGHLKELEKEQTKHKAGRRKEIKIKAEISEIEKRKQNREIQ